MACEPMGRPLRGAIGRRGCLLGVWVLACVCVRCAWVPGCVGAWVRACVGAWVSGLVGARMYTAVHLPWVLMGQPSPSSLATAPGRHSSESPREQGAVSARSVHRRGVIRGAAGRPRQEQATKQGVRKTARNKTTGTRFLGAEDGACRHRPLRQGMKAPKSGCQTRKISAFPWGKVRGH